MNQHQPQVIEYFLEENRVLREQTGTRPMPFDDDRQLAAEAPGRKPLTRVATIVTPETLLGWQPEAGCREIRWRAP